MASVGDAPRGFVRTKEVGHLRDLIQNENLSGKLDVMARINHQKVLGNNPPFEVQRREELPLDDEQRICHADFRRSKVIFDLEKITIKDPTAINIKDCLFMGDLYIMLDDHVDPDCYLDTCVVLGTLMIFGSQKGLQSLCLADVRAHRLDLREVKATSLHIDGSAFGETRFYRLQSDVFRAHGNAFGLLTIQDCDVSEVAIPAGQVDLAQTLAFPPGKSQNGSFNPLAYPLRSDADMDRLLDTMIRTDQWTNQLQTIDFLMTHSGERHSKRDLARLRYARTVTESPTWMSRALVRLTGGFVRPWVFIAWSFFVVVMSAWIFRLPGAQLTPPISSFVEALYFSGITFTTIGYGAPAPGGWAEGFAALEGGLGVLLAGCFVVSLVKRYIE